VKVRGASLYVVMVRRDDVCAVKVLPVNEIVIGMMADPSA